MTDPAGAAGMWAHWAVPVNGLEGSKVEVAGYAYVVAERPASSRR